jgi:hypothetical protein
MYTQGLGKPRMSSGERVLDMMAQLDEHSEKIPEGMYLQFCDHLNFFHQNVENEKKGLAIARGVGGGVGGRGKAGGRDEKATGERAAGDPGGGRAEEHVHRRGGERGGAAGGGTTRAASQGQGAREREAEREAERGSRRCGCCRQLGHNRRTCPQRVQ